MSDNKVFIEQQIIKAIRGLLSGRVNEILRDWEYLIPIVEFGAVGCGYTTSPVISISSCERMEKERIIKLDAYSVSITFTLQEHPDGELYCYGYATAFTKALGENPVLGGIVDRAVVTGKKYIQPKKPGCGEGWGVVISLRVTVEGFDK